MGGGGNTLEITGGEGTTNNRGRGGGGGGQGPIGYPLDPPLVRQTDNLFIIIISVCLHGP